MTEYILYKAKQNDRWDILAYRFYGDMYRQKELIEANGHVKLTPSIEEGEQLFIPILEDLPTTSIPIWKQ